jgi:uncharacterized GH25 family protein
VRRAALLLAVLLAAPARAEERRVLVLGPDGLPAPQVFRARAEAWEDGRVLLRDATGATLEQVPGGLLVPEVSPEVVWAPGSAAAAVPTSREVAGIRLAPALSLSGRVAPVAEGRALLAFGDVPRGVAFAASTDAEGRFRFALLSAGAWTLALLRGDGRVEALGTHAAGSDVGEVLLPERGPLTGRVLDALAPGRTGVGGFEIRLVPLPATGGPSGRLVTGPDGAFAVEDMAPGVYEARPADPRWAFDPAPPRFAVLPLAGARMPPWLVVRLPAVRGRVVDREGRGLAGAEVRLLPDPTRTTPPGGWGPTLLASTDADGRFALESVRAADGYRLAISRPGSAPEVTDPFDVVDGAGADVGDVRLHEGWRLEVVTLEVDGTPARGVPVRAAPVVRPGGHGAGATEVRTDARGLAVLADLPPEDVLVVAGGGPFLAVETTIVAPPAAHTREWTATVHRAPGLVGRVVGPGGASPRPVDVTATPRDGSEPHRVSAEEDGTFRFEALPATPVDLVVLARGETGVPPLARYDGALPGQREEVRIPLPELRAVGGSVSGLDPDGGPAEVRLEAPVPDPEAEIHRWRTVAAQSLPSLESPVAFVFDAVAPGAYAVRAAQGRRDSGAVPVTVEEGNVGPLIVRIPVGGMLRGRVRARTGIGVVGADVRARRVRDDGDVPHEGVWTVTTDEDGAFEIPGFGAGTWRLEATAEGYARARQVVRLDEGGVIEVPDLLLGEGGALAGRIRGEDGRGIEGAALRLVRAGDAEEPVVAETGHEGVYRAERLEPGVWRVEIEGLVGALAGAEAIAEIVEGQTTTLDVHLEGGGRIEGRVTRRGIPVAGATVELLLASDTAGVPVRTLVTTTGPGGGFAWDHLEAGTYVVDVVDGVVRRAATLELIDRDRLQVDLELDEGRLVGVVRDLDGRGVGGARVEATGLSIGTASVWTDPEGRFLLTGLPPGSYDLLATAPGRPPGRRTGVRAEPAGSEERVEVVLGLGGSVHLAVLDETGRGVAGASVWVEATDGRALHPRAYVTDPTGQLLLEGVPEGEQRLRVHARGYGRPPLVPVALREGDVLRRVVTLRTGGSIALRILADLDPVARARVRLVRLDVGEVVEARRPLSRLRWASHFGDGTGGYVPRTGVVRFEDLEEGAYRIHVAGGPALEEAELDVDLARGEALATEMVLRRSP